MHDQIVVQVSEMLKGGIPPELLLQSLIDEGMPPDQAESVIAKASQPASKAQEPRPMNQQRPQQPPPQRSSQYSSIPGQPNSSTHVRTASPPDPQVKQAHSEAQKEMEKIARQHYATETTIAQQKMLMWLAKYVGWCLMVGDAIFSYWALKVSLDNKWVALHLAIGIGVAILVMGTAISVKAIDEIFVLDKNEDGKVTFGEYFWFSVRVFIAVTCVSTDIISNYMGMDYVLAGTLSPTNLIPGPVIAMLLAISIMLLPQVIVTWSDVAYRKLCKLEPVATMEAADIQGDKNYAVGYRRKVATQTTPVGESEGNSRVRNWKVRF